MNSTLRSPKIGVVAGATASFAAMMTFALRGAPITEGWWHVYAIWLAEGRVPYQDFELLVPPGYPLFIRLLIGVGFESFFSLRIIGAAVCAAISAVLHLTFRHFISSGLAWLISLCSLFVLAQGSAFISYDYDQIAALLLVGTVYMAQISVLSTGQDVSGKAICTSFIAALLAGSCFLIKTSIGFSAVMTLVAMALSIWRVGGQNLGRRMFLPLSAGFALPLVAVGCWLFSRGALSEGLHSTLGGAVAKGGFGKMLTRSFLMFRVGTIQEAVFLVAPVLMLSILLSSLNALRSHHDNRRLGATTTGLFSLFKLISTIGVSLVFCVLFWRSFFDAIVSYSIVPSVFAPLLLLGVKSLRTPALAPLAVAAASSSVATMWSAGLSPMGRFLPAGLMLLMLFTLLHGAFSARLMLIVISSILSIGTITHKREIPYSWWFVESDLTGLTLPVRSGLSEGLVDSVENVALLSAIASRVPTKDGCEGESVHFPHIPQVLLNLGETPGGRLGQYWFDFSSSREVELERSRLASVKVRSISILELPSEVSNQHKRLFGASQTEQLDALREDLVARGTGEMVAVLDEVLASGARLKIFVDPNCL